MIVVVPIALVAAVGLTAWILELRGRRPSAEPLSRGHRAGLAFLLGLLAFVAFSPGIAMVFERPLPVDPPANPLAGEGCHDDGSGDALIIVFALVIYFGARTGFGILGALVRSIAGSPPRVVTGKPAMTVAAFFLGVIFPIVSARLLLPGPSPEDFTTYGALTPDRGARGWRAEHVIDGLRDGPIEDLPLLGVTVSDITDDEDRGHGSYDSGPHLKPGLHAWVDGQPVLIFDNGDGLVGAHVGFRSPDHVPAERRPFFQSWPRVAPRPGADGWVLVERRPDGSLFAVKTFDSGGAESVDQRDVWLLVHPSEIPHGIAFVLFLLGLAAARTSQRRGNTPGFALIAAWLWLEAGALDLFAYAPNLGL